MQDFSNSSSPAEQPPPPKRSGFHLLLWVLLALAALVLLPCCGLLGWLVYVGSYGPETSVYTGNEVPARFLDVMEEVGALEPGEKLLYFYSDALADIRGGFYFVSDRGVVIYSETTGDGPLTRIPFDEIADVDLAREESFFIDSEITLEMKDGLPLSFPVSSEGDKDVRFFESIQDGMAKARPPDLQAEKDG